MKSYPAKSEIIWENIAINDPYLTTRIQRKQELFVFFCLAQLFKIVTFRGFSELVMIQAVTFCLIPERWVGHVETTFVFTFSPSQKGAELPGGEFFWKYYHHTYLHLPFVLFVLMDDVWGADVYPLWFRYHPYLGEWGKRQMFEKPIDLPSRAKKMDKLRQESQIHIRTNRATYSKYRR